jgi:Cu/Zn superoxide dismutase
VKQRLVWPVFAFLGLAVVAACGSSGTSGPSRSTAMSSSASGGMSTRVTLQHEPRGEAKLTLAGNKLTVAITLIGLAPNSTHPAHIHGMGNCSSNSPVIYPLKNVVANAAGTASVTSTIDGVASIPASGWYINVHNGPALTPPDQFSPIACGEVKGGSNEVTVPLQKGSGPSQAASGTAALSLANGQLTVKITMSGLTPNSAHAAHIHVGSCTNQGAVVHPLTNVTADGNGNAMSSTTVAGVTSIPSAQWYINVHGSTNLNTQTGFDPIACGNVTP